MDHQSFRYNTASHSFNNGDIPGGTYDVREGDIMKAKPKYFEPRPPSTGNIGQHPVIVLTRPDAYGKVRVATMSHSHPNNPPTRPASRYNLPIDPLKGESSVCVGQPQIIHISYLRPNNPHAMMSRRDFAALKSEICRNCPELTRELNF